MVAELFLDTNILVYAVVPSAPFHKEALEQIQKFYQQGTRLVISVQVIREYLSVLSRQQTFASPCTMEILSADVRQFKKVFRVLEDNLRVSEKLLEITESTQIGGKQIHDANIVATMLTFGIHDLLTHNVSDFKSFQNQIQIHPLSTK